MYLTWAVPLPTVSDLAHRHWLTILTLHYNQRLLKVAMWLQTVLSLFFVRLHMYYCKQYSQASSEVFVDWKKFKISTLIMPFLSILWLFTWKWSIAIFLDYHGPGHKQITKVRWVYFFFFFSDECCPKCDLEKINHCVNGVAPVSIYRDWLASQFQTQSCQSCSSLMPRAKNLKVWIWLFFPSYKLLILYPTVSDPM